MKKLLLLTIVFTLTFGGCKKKKENDEDPLSPSQEQRGFAINYTAKWCGPCGNWGAPLIHHYADEAPDGAIICAHAAGDPMNNGLYSSFRNDRTTNGGIPSFWVGDTFTQSNNAMNSLLNQSAIAGVDYRYSIDGNTIKVDTKVKFFDNGQGDYYLSVIILEDGIPGDSSTGDYAQSGTSQSYPNDDYHHDFVLRASSVQGEAYGEKITTNPSSGSEEDNSYSIDIESGWNKDNIYPVCIIWKYDSSGQYPRYKYINSLKKKN